MYHSRKVNFISSPCTEAASDIHLEEAMRYTQFWFPNNLKTDILPWPPLCNGAKNAGDCENVGISPCSSWILYFCTHCSAYSHILIIVWDILVIHPFFSWSVNSSLYWKENGRIPSADQLGCCPVVHFITLLKWLMWKRRWRSFEAPQPPWMGLSSAEETEIHSKEIHERVTNHIWVIQNNNKK